MENLKRYNLDYWPDEGKTVMSESPDGEWVKFDDIKELLNPTNIRKRNPCPYCKGF